MDLYFDGHSYRRPAENIGQYFDQDTTPVSVYRWVRDLTEKADSVVKPMKVATSGVWVADEVVVSVGGERWRYG